MRTMRTTWMALAWKEWRESRWKLLAVLCMLMLSLGVAWLTSREVLHFESIQIAILLPILPITVLIATSTAANERSQGTLAFLGALPVSPRRVAVIKLSTGLATCLIPVFLVLGIIFIWWMCWDLLGVDLKTSMKVAADAWRGPFNLLNWFAATGTAMTLWIVSLFLWSAAGGVNRADEVSAGAMALALIAGVWLGFLAIAFLIGAGEPDVFFESHPTLVTLASAIAPGGFPHMRPLNFSHGWTEWGVVGLFVVVQTVLATSFVVRFGCNSASRSRSNQPISAIHPRHDWLASPRRSPFSAIVWKQLRESGPLALAGLAGVVLIMVAGVIVTARTQSSVADTRDVVAASILFGSIYLGALTTLVIGIGVFLRDLEAGIHTFWRSRPIDPSAWYWVKFLTGLAVVALTFFLPMLIAPLLMSENQFYGPVGNSELFWLQGIAAGTIFAAYAIAIATTCLLRSAVFATVLTMAGLYLAALVPSLMVYAYRYATSPLRPEFPEGSEAQRLVLFGMLLAAIISMIVGWFAVRNSWSLQGRS